VKRVDDLIRECESMAADFDGSDDQAADVLRRAADELERLSQLYRPGYVTAGRLRAMKHRERVGS